MGKKINFGNRANTKNSSLHCRQCGTMVKNVDTESVSCLCWRCVCRLSDPNVVIMSDLNAEEFSNFFKSK